MESEKENDIDNVNDIVVSVQRNGQSVENKYPERNGYKIERQKKEWWHFILTNDPNYSVFKTINEIRNYQVDIFNIQGSLTTKADLDSFVSELTPNENWEIYTHVHHSQPNKLLVIRIFHDMYIPV